MGASSSFELPRPSVSKWSCRYPSERQTGKIHATGTNGTFSKWDSFCFKAINVTCFSNALALAIIMKKRLPKATVNNQMACMTDRMLSGACGSTLSLFLLNSFLIYRTADLSEWELEAGNGEHYFGHGHDEKLWNEPKHVDGVCGWNLDSNCLLFEGNTLMKIRRRRVRDSNLHFHQCRSTTAEEPRRNTLLEEALIQ